MPEFRKDIITDDWVIIATERAKRPEDFTKTRKVSGKGMKECPFDPGNEELTPPEILRVDKNGKIIGKDSGWQIRIVPNKFPALLNEATTKKVSDGFYSSMDSFGIHEVIINTPRHLTSLSDLDLKDLRLMFFVYRLRIGMLKKIGRLKSVIVMLNQGMEAGASLEHSHSQIFALPLIPYKLKRELEGMKRYHNKTGDCALCYMIDHEDSEKKRVVFQNKHFMVIEPYASKGPFETWILPKRHHSNFENISDSELDSFTECLKLLLDFFSDRLENPSFNYYIHTGPINHRSHDYYHWHFEFIPKLSIKAGFEIATGIHISITSPEAAASYIRNNI